MEIVLLVIGGIVKLVKDLLLKFIPAKRKVRGEVIAKGEAHLQLAESSLTVLEQRLGWSPGASRFLATAFAFQATDGLLSVMEKAQEIHGSETFEQEFTRRAEEDPSIIGPTLQASKYLTSEDLRNLLGRILASDVQEPGSVSRRTVSIAENLSPTDLREFMKLRSIAWRTFDSDVDYLLIVGERSSLFFGEKFLSFDLRAIDLSYSSTTELKHLGLIEEQPGGIVLITIGDETEIQLAYRNKTLSVQLTEEVPTDDLGSASLPTGMYGLTKPGAEILNLYINDTYPSPKGYFEEVCQRWQKDGWKVMEMKG